jgi:two-component system, cell cycle sensor histidine kinase and response regulator CckA
MADNSQRRAIVLEKLNIIKVQVDELQNSISDLAGEEPAGSEDSRFVDSLLELIPDAIFFKDIRSRYLLVNKACLSLLELPFAGHAYGKTDFDFFSPEYARNTYLEEQHLMYSGVAELNREVTIPMRDGTSYNAVLTRMPVRSALGETIGIVGIIRPLRETESGGGGEGITDVKLHRLLSSSADILSIVDANATLLYESPSSAGLLGHEPAFSRIGVNIFGFCHPADLNNLMDGFNRVVREPGKTKKITYRVRHADGTWVLLESVFRNLLEDPAVQGVIVSSRDISDVQRAQERVTIFEHVVKSVNDSIIITDLRGNIIFVNQAFCNTYRYTTDEIVGQNISLLWSERAQGESLESILKNTMEVGWEGEVYHKKKDGAEYNVYLTSTVVKDGVGTPIALTAIARDITKNKQIEEQLRHSQKMESLGVLVGGIAHNFNNILGVIMGYASLLEEGESDREKLIRNARIITEAAERGAHLVHQLMMYIKKSPVHFEPVSVNDAIEELTSMVKQTFPQTITFIHTLDERFPNIHADINQFKQVLFNIYLNARDAMLQGGTITVSSTVVAGAGLKGKFLNAKDTEYVCIAVTDTGIGMDEEIKSRIFDPFFTTKEIGKGIGLGLTMVYGMVESHMGFIDVESTADKGSTFRLYFPLQGFRGKIAEKDKKVTTPTGDERKTIFVVEDEDPLRELLVRTLRDTGYRVISASDGVEALKVFGEARDRVDLVVLDLGLPKLSGYDVLKRIRELNPDLSIIVASGFSDPDLKESLDRTGVNYFLQKPYKRSTILNVIRTLLTA